MNELNGEPNARECVQRTNFRTSLAWSVIVRVLDSDSFSRLFSQQISDSPDNTRDTSTNDMY
eukprot:scaffold99748_cov29-Attheya_sp.AAC.1